MKKKIALFIRGFHHGGIEALFESFFAHMDLSDLEIHIITYMKNDSEKKHLFEDLGCIIHELSPIRGSKITGKNIREYRALFNANAFDVVHCNIPEILLPLLFAKLHKVPTRILHAHSNYKESRSSSNPLFLAAFNAGFALNTLMATHLLAASESAAISAFGKRKTKDALILPNVIDVDAYSFDAAKREKMRQQLGIGDEICFGHVGRYESDIKNQKFVLEAFRDYLQENPAAQLIMIGDGPLREQHQELANSLKIADKVTFTGGITNVPDYLQAMDCFLLPSKKEGFGLAALEAQTCGLPCILADCIPPEVKVTNLVTFVEIDKGTAPWVAAMKALRMGTREGFANQVRQAGYGAKEQAALLSDIYRASR